MMSVKLASSQVSVVAARGAALIRELSTKVASLTDENHSLREKIAGMERDQQVRAIAADMEEKGLNADLSFDEKIAHIQKHTNLSQVQEAVKMASSGSIRIATVTAKPGKGGAVDGLTEFCLTGN